MHRSWRSVIRTGLAAAAFVAFATGAIDERTLECEQAMAHLGDCCPKLHVPAACGGGCSNVTLRLEESSCIQDRSCGELLDTGVCDRVEEISANEAQYTDATWVGVCP